MIKTDEESLLQQIEELETKEAMPELLYLDEAIRIYRKLIRLRPAKAEYKYSLAKLLLEMGRNEKFVTEDYEQASDLFREVLKLKPGYAQAHYHLGWLARYEDHWLEALEHYKVSLESASLNHLERIYALCSSAYCQARLGNGEDAWEALKKAKELARERSERSFVDEAKQSVSLVLAASKAGFSESLSEDLSAKRLYICIDNHGENYVSKEEAEALASHKDHLVLDLRARRVTLKGPHRWAWKLEDGAGQLLEYLWLNSGYHKAEKIQEAIWPESRGTSTVKKYVAELRKSIDSCLETREEGFINNEPGKGYSWQGNLPYRIIRPITFTWIRYYEQSQYQ